MNWVRHTAMGCLLLSLTMALAADDTYRREIDEDRQQTDAMLRSERSPLLLIGRFEIQEGATTLGSDPASTIALPPRAAQRVGVVHRRGTQLSFEVAGGVAASLNGKPVSGLIALQAMEIPKPTDRVSFGDFTFGIRPVGDGFSLFLQDTQSPFAKKFKGVSWFPIDPAYRVAAQLTPYAGEKTVMVPYTDGIPKPYTVAGYLMFQIAGQPLRLETLVSLGGKKLVVMFQDQTSGKETYGGGRYVEVDMPQDGKTTIDFNKAFNPYCAYDPYASCPVPLKENRLAVAIRAGATYNDAAH